MCAYRGLAFKALAFLLYFATAGLCQSLEFTRGDSNSDGKVDISDGISSLGFLFLGAAAPSCLDAADADDSGDLDLTDGIFTFQFLFLGGPPPPAPGHLQCGPDPTTDNLGCASSPLCSKPPVVTKLEGPPGDPAREHIPDIPFPPAVPDEFTVSEGIPVSRVTLAVFFRENATVSDANTLLSSIGARIIGGEPVIDMLLLAIPESNDLTRMMSALAQLRASSLVVVAVPNVQGAIRLLPPHHTDELGFGWSWDTNVPPLGSNYGLELIRTPQMWNLRTHGLRHGGPSDVGIIDAGFDVAHADLSPRLQQPAGPPGFPALPALGPNDHGTHVAGIMAASWGNQAGVEGIAAHNPNVFALQINGGAVLNEVTHLQELQSLYRRILSANPNVRAVNMSFGLPNYAAGVNPQTAVVNPPDPRTWAQLMNDLGAAHNHSAATFAQRVRSNFLFAAAVGYDAQPGVIRVQDDSPMSNAAIAQPTGHYIAVEAIDSNNAYNPGGGVGQMSFNLGGTVSAPGYAIRSAEVSGGGDWDGDGDLNYATMNGTSMASPHVTGLISALWHLDPTLTFGEVRTLITDPAYTVVTDKPNLRTRPRIDAFAAAMGIDVIKANKTLQSALVDIDDGSRDGNLRADPFTGATYTTVDTADGLRGDTQVTIRDFRAWRDAYLQVNAADFAGSGLTVALDGPQTHFKKDLNFDGCVASLQVVPLHPAAEMMAPPASCASDPTENVHPRFDFNGDGRIGQWFQTSPFKMDPDALDPDSPPGQNRSFTLRSAPGFLRDIDVLADQDLWVGSFENIEVDPGVEGSPAPAEREWGPRRFLLGNRDAGIAILEDIPDYLHSFDLHVRVDWSRINNGYEALSIVVSSEMRASFDQVFEQRITLPHGVQSPVLTMPLWTGNVRVKFETVDDQIPEVTPADAGYVEAVTKELTGVGLGQDLGIIFPRFPTVIDDLAAGRTNMRVDAAGNIYVAYEQLVSSAPDGSELREHFFARSTDQGVSFTTRLLAREERRRDSLAVSADGKVYLVHVIGNPSDPAPPGSALVQLLRSEDGGQTFTPKEISTPGTSNVDFHTSVAVDGAGTVYVVWAESGLEFTAPEKKNPFMIRLRTSVDGGQNFSAPVTIHADPDPGALWNPRDAKVAVTAAGQVHVTWTECISRGAFNACVRFRLLHSQSTGGGPFSAPVDIAQNEFLPGSYDMAVDDLGGVSVVYATHGPSNSTIRYVRVEAGAMVRTVDASQSPANFFAVTPRVMVDQFRRAWITWSENTPPVPSDVYTLVTTDGGQSFSTFTNVSSSPTSPSGASSMAPDQNGAPLMVWGEQTPKRLLFRPLLNP